MSHQRHIERLIEMLKKDIFLFMREPGYQRPRPLAITQHRPPAAAAAAVTIQRKHFQEVIRRDKLRRLGLRLQPSKIKKN